MGEGQQMLQKGRSNRHHRATKTQSGEEMGAGGQRKQLRKERLCHCHRCHCCPHHQAVWAKTWGREWQEDNDDNNGRRGGRVFVIDVLPLLALARLRSQLLSTPFLQMETEKE